MMSVLETQFSGEDVIIIAPDSDNLSILQVGDSRASNVFKAGIRSREIITVRPPSAIFHWGCQHPCSSMPMDPLTLRLLLSART